MNIGKKNTFVFVLSILTLVTISSFVSSSFWSDITGKATSQNVATNISVGVPKITFVGAPSAQNPTENSFLPIIFYATANDGAGASVLSNMTANFTIAGNPVRSNSSCVKVGNIDSNNVNYSCTVNLWYFDTSGTWNIGVAVNDTYGNNAYNTTQTFTYNQLSAFVLGPGSLSWNAFAPGSQNQTPTNGPLILNNTGNKPITVGNIQINGTNLRGETDSTKAIWANNISLSTFTGGSPPVECNSTSTNMSAGGFVGIAVATLGTGNLTLNNGTGQSRLYPCIKIAGAELTSQSYSTANESSWTVKIV